MDQCNHGTDSEMQPESRAEGRTKAHPDVDAHHDRRRNDRHRCAKTEILADLRPHVLDPAYLEFARAELLREALLDLVPQCADLGGALLQTDQILVGVPFAEVLNHRTA